MPGAVNQRLAGGRTGRAGALIKAGIGAMTVRLARPAAAIPHRRLSPARAAIIDGIARFCCRHQFVAHHDFLRCALCAFKVSELPLSKPGAIILRGVFGSR